MSELDWAKTMLLGNLAAISFWVVGIARYSGRRNGFWLGVFIFGLLSSVVCVSMDTYSILKLTIWAVAK